MKIAILHAGDLENLALGGVDQYIKNLIRNKKKNEIFVYGTCVYGSYKLGQKYAIKNNGLEYYFIPVSDDRTRPLTLGYLRNELRFIKEISEYDIIYSQRIEFTIPFVLDKKARNKLVQVIHGSSYYTTLHWGKIKSFIYEFVERLSISIAKKTNVVLMREEFGVPYYLKKYKKYKERIGYTKVPVDTKIFRSIDMNKCRTELNLPLDKVIIMYGGRVENNPKRVLLFPEILKKLNENQKKYYLVVIGDGKDLVNLRLMLQESNDEETFNIVGYLENRDIFVKYINASDVNLNISEFEGTCTSSLEAVACGTPIVSTDAGDIRLFCGDGKNGFIVKNKSEEEIVLQTVKAIKKIADKQVEMTDAFKRYDCKVVTEELFDQFKQLL